MIKLKDLLTEKKTISIDTAQDMRKEIPRAQKMFGSKIEITNEPKDINKWIFDRGDAFF